MSSNFIFTHCGFVFFFKKRTKNQYGWRMTGTDVSMSNSRRPSSLPSHGQECTGNFVFRVETVLLWTTASSKGGKQSRRILK